MNSRVITELSSAEALEFFIKTRNYINFDLPYYLDFDQLLTFVHGALRSKTLTSVCRIRRGKKDQPRNYEAVNHTILSNKDGAYSWRPLQIIHPVLYIDLVQRITEKKSWEYLQKRFHDFSKTYVNCISLPRESSTKQSDRATLISHWWEKIEQQSIAKALEYDHVFLADISNCYGAIYTHSYEWALDPAGRSGVKRRIIDRRESTTIGGKLGSAIDGSLRGMNYNQTNSIPQGSTLMDFLAEVILGYSDEQLTEAIDVAGIKPDQFFIVRYRDDYRIFVNDPNIGHQILKSLSDVLYLLNLKINAAKTKGNDDVITASIKPEKLERILISPTEQPAQREALRIYQIAKNHPNSGMLNKELGIFYDNLKNHKKYKHYGDLDVLITIFTMISFHSPASISWVSAIISSLLQDIKDSKHRQRIISRIHKRFEKVPNAGFTDVWLQRISAPLNIEIPYSEVLTDIALNKRDNESLWCSDWLESDVKKLINAADISSLKIQLEDNTIPPVIQREEVELFKIDYF